jgi:hypothetical protein
MTTQENSNATIEINTVATQDSEGNIMQSTTVQTVSAETTTEPQVSKLELMIQSVDTSTALRKTLAQTEAKLVELQNATVLLRAQIEGSHEKDASVRAELIDFADNMRTFCDDESVIVFAASKKFGLPVPTVKPNAANAPAPNSTEAQEKAQARLAAKLGKDTNVEEQVLAFIAKNPEGVGLGRIAENFPEFDKQKLGGFVRGLAQTNKVLVAGLKKGSKYYPRTAVVPAETASDNS